MTKLSFSVAPVDLSAQGAEFSVDPTDFAPVALEAIFTYGVRRWFQDNINSAAHAFKQAAADAAKDGQPFASAFDVQAAFAARLTAAKTGELSPARSRSVSPAFTSLEESIYAVAVENKSAPAFKPVLVAWGESKGASVTERKTAILRAVSALPDKARLAIVKAAESRLAIASSLSDLDL